jgi:hypothetical protein
MTLQSSGPARKAAQAGHFHVSRREELVDKWQAIGPRNSE